MTWLGVLVAWLTGRHICATSFCRNSAVVPFHRHDGVVVWRCFTCARWARAYTTNREETAQ